MILATCVCPVTALQRKRQRVREREGGRKGGREGVGGERIRISRYSIHIRYNCKSIDNLSFIKKKRKKEKKNRCVYRLYFKNNKNIILINKLISVMKSLSRDIH